MKFPQIWISPLIIASMSLPAMAQDTKNNNDVVKLPTIQVLSDKAEEILKTPGALSIVTKEELNETKPMSSQEAIKKTAGANVIEAEGVAYIGLRGLNPDGSRKLLLLEDGAPIALGPYIDASAYYAPMIERMERIDVRKGSSSLAFGPSSIGGAINYITKNPTQLQGNAITLSGGSRDYKSVLVEGSAVRNGSGFLVNAFSKEGNGSRQNSEFNTHDILLKYGGALSEKSYVGVKFSYYKSKAQLTYLGLTQKLYEEDAYQNPAENDYLYINRYEANLTHDYLINETSRISTLVYVNSTARDWWRQNFTKDGSGNITMGSGNKGRNRQFDVAGVDSRYFTEWSMGDSRNDLQVGLRLHTEDMTNTEIVGATPTARSGTIDAFDKRFANAQALYLENQTQLGNWTITPGVRIESYRQARDILRKASADTQLGSSTNNTETLAGIGTTYNLTPTQVFFAGAHQGFSPPRVQDAIDNNGTAVELDAERSTNAEIGYRQYSPLWNLELAAFHLDFANQLIQGTESGGASATLTNAGKTLHQGVEVTARYSPTEWSNLYLDANATYIPVAKYNSTRIIASADRNGNRLPYSPEYLANISMGYKKDQWLANLQYNYVGEQFADAENTKEGSVDGMRGLLPAYGIWNASGDYKVSEQWSTSLNIKNILDQKYISSRAPQGIFPGTRRTIYLSIKSQF